MNPRLVFIDDDPHELEDLRSIVQDRYEFRGIKWPFAEGLEEEIGEPPAIFLLDLYFPPEGRNAPDQVRPEIAAIQAGKALEIAERLSKLYSRAGDGKALLRDTFACIRATYDLLWEQCRELN